MRTKYTKEQMFEAVSKVSSYIELLTLLNLKKTGGNHSHISRIVKHYGIDTSHWKRKTTKGRTFHTVPIETYLNNEKQIASNPLKKRLIKEGLFEYKCYHCLNTDWMGKPIPLELHHIDHNHMNNNLANLVLLCPNCHAQRHTVKPYEKKPITLKPERRKVDRPPYEQLISEIDELGYCAVGRKYGVSDNAVRKWVKMYNKYG